MEKEIDSKGEAVEAAIKVMGLNDQQANWFRKAAQSNWPGVPPEPKPRLTPQRRYILEELYGLDAEAILRREIYQWEKREEKRYKEIFDGERLGDPKKAIFYHWCVTCASRMPVRVYSRVHPLHCHICEDLGEAERSQKNAEIFAEWERRKKADLDLIASEARPKCTETCTQCGTAFSTYWHSDEKDLTRGSPMMTRTDPFHLLDVHQKKKCSLCLWNEITEYYEKEHDLQLEKEGRRVPLKWNDWPQPGEPGYEEPTEEEKWELSRYELFK